MKSGFKDMEVIKEMANNQDIELPPVVSGALWTYKEALQEGYGSENKGAMIKVWEKRFNSCVLAQTKDVTKQN